MVQSGPQASPAQQTGHRFEDPQDQRELVRTQFTSELTDAVDKPMDPMAADPISSDPRSDPMLDPRVPRGAPQLYQGVLGYPDRWWAQ